jgi:hypothetical protein
LKINTNVYNRANCVCDFCHQTVSYARDVKVCDDNKEVDGFVCPECDEKAAEASVHSLQVSPLDPKLKEELKILALNRRVLEHYDEACALGYEVFGVFLQGSQNYNLDIYTDEYASDVDTKAILLPPFDDFCSCKSPISTTHERQNKEHIDLKDIRTIFENFKKQNVNFIEILFTDFFTVSEEYYDFYMRLRALGERLAHCHPTKTLRAMSGMSMEKKAALCHPYPTIKWKIDKWGYDGKQLHHIIRINDFMTRYIAGVPFADCLKVADPKLKNILMDAKLNRFSLEEALKLAKEYDDANKKLKDDYIEEYGDVVDNTPYQELNDIKIEVLKDYFKRQLR